MKRKITFRGALREAAYVEVYLDLPGVGSFYLPTTKQGVKDADIADDLDRLTVSVEDQGAGAVAGFDADGAGLWYYDGRRIVLGYD